MPQRDKEASSGPHTGVLLVNLGTPDSPSVADVRKYLREFLLDGRVIDIPTLPRWLLVNGIIAPFRGPKSAKAYKEVWMQDGGSPLKYYSLKLEEKVQAQLGAGYAVRLAMRYQNPSIAAKLEELKALPITRLVVLPLFPQYASATNGSVTEEVMRILSTWQTMPHLRFVHRFFDRVDFTEAFSQVARPRLEAGNFEHILFSYHGLPERQIRKGDTQGVCVLGDCCNTYTERNQWCYRAQCFATTRNLAKALGLVVGTYTTTFQSRLGKDPWIQPYTNDTIRTLRKQGVKRVAVLSPAFVADCLETILEIGEEYKELFEELGGEHWELIPSLNDTPKWVDVVCSIVTE